MYLLERVCRARAENSEVVRWDRILLPKKGEEKTFVVFAEKKIDRQSGFSSIEREKREKMSSLQKDDYDDDEDEGERREKQKEEKIVLESSIRLR